MLKEQMKRGHAVIAFGVVYVAIGLLLLSFCVDHTYGYEIGESENYVFERVTVSDIDFGLTSRAPTGEDELNLFSEGAFRDISFYQDLRAIILTCPSSRLTWDEDAPWGAQTDVTVYIKNTSIVLGEGIIWYKRGGVTTDIYVSFDITTGDYFHSGNYTDTLYVSFAFDSYDLYNLSFASRGVETAYDTYDDVYGFSFTSARAWGCALGTCDFETEPGTSYVMRYADMFRNDAVITKTSDVAYRVDVTRNFPNVVYKSDWVINTSETEFYNESLGEEDFTVYVYGQPIRMYVTDIYDYDYYDEFIDEEDVGINNIYGYVFDAADSFGLGNVVVNFQDQNMTTSDTGFYSFNSDTFGDSWLNLSRTGYQNSNLTFDYQGSTRLDIYMVANETVNPGTCTVVGIVYDSDLHPIDDAYVKIFNDTFSTYIYTSSSGYFVFYDLTNTTYSLSAEHPDYIKQQKSINLTDLDTAYYYTFTLLGEGVTPGITPTPTPTVAPDMIDAIDVWWDILGLLEWKGLIYAMTVIGGLGMALGVVSGGNGWVAAIGAFFGFVLSVAFGWIPIWVVALGLIGAAIIMVKVLGSDNR